tara:strand:- start:667 stop:792 length:126 start_codon:yes stop_codon:yes gene_type:complete
MFHSDVLGRVPVMHFDIEQIQKQKRPPQRVSVSEKSLAVPV